MRWNALTNTHSRVGFASYTDIPSALCASIQVDIHIDIDVLYVHIDMHTIMNHDVHLHTLIHNCAYTYIYFLAPEPLKTDALSSFFSCG